MGLHILAKATELRRADNWDDDFLTLSSSLETAAATPLIGSLTEERRAASFRDRLGNAAVGVLGGQDRERGARSPSLGRERLPDEKEPRDTPCCLDVALVQVLERWFSVPVGRSASREDAGVRRFRDILSILTASLNRICECPFSSGSPGPGGEGFRQPRWQRKPSSNGVLRP